MVWMSASPMRGPRSGPGAGALGPKLSVPEATSAPGRTTRGPAERRHGASSRTIPSVPSADARPAKENLQQHAALVPFIHHLQRHRSTVRQQLSTESHRALATRGRVAPKKAGLAVRRLIPSGRTNVRKHVARPELQARLFFAPTSRLRSAGAVARLGPIGYEVDMKILVLGLGNPLVTDDSVGLRIAAKLRDLLAGRPEVEVGEDFCGGLRLMERMIGYDRAIVIDAIQTGAPPGTLHRLAVDSIPTQRSASAHDASLPTALALGRLAGAALPRDEDILLVGIEADDVLSFGEECTPAVRDAIGPAVQLVVEAVDRLLD